MPQFLKAAWDKSKESSNQKIYDALKALVDTNDDIKKHFSEEDIRCHYATKLARNNVNHPDLFINQIRYFRLYEYFKNHHSEILKPKVSVLNVGDSSGILLKALHKKGVSLDANAKNIEQIEARGIEAYTGSIYELPFPDKSFDYSMSFQCLEHLEAPIFALQELERVTRKRVFISIPYVEQTKIYSKMFWEEVARLPQEQGGWEVNDMDEYCDYHIIEFSSKDFKNLLSYTNLECEHNYPINYFESLGASEENKGSYFNFFDLKVKG